MGKNAITLRICYLVLRGTGTVSYQDPPATSGPTCSVVSRSSTVDLGYRWLASITTLASDPANPRWNIRIDSTSLAYVHDSRSRMAYPRRSVTSKNRQKKSAFGSNKYRQKALANSAPAAAANMYARYRSRLQTLDPTTLDPRGLIWTVTNIAGSIPLRTKITHGRSRYCIYAFVHKPAVDPGNKQRDLHDNTFDLCGKRTPVDSNVCQVYDFSRPSEALVMNLDPECQRGYWKQRDLDLWFKPAVGEVVTKIPGSSRVEAYYSVDALDHGSREAIGSNIP
ncbi:unnamed protein product [Phytophthora fragariaefolia]|uniref:Unnamed protein product n=1 Tax=Phytophthora fragariaefolia TaxID=1490495 RepID=A0A9W6X7G0_9STRA|nr:unnamed protein product [Phytophthora fragariaefolia]